jgi:5'-methylthioadenosine phosphorylase
MVFVISVTGGSGFYTFFGDDARSINVDTPYGEPSAPITVGQMARRILGG